ncbi:MAG: GTP pyrophosphokinase family protein [Eisenbergiella massiliensis]
MQSCAKKGYEETYDVAQEKINDIVGVRAVCSFMDDLYLVAKALEQHRDVRTVKVKDYLQEPKRSGYRSLHLIVEVPIYFQGEELWRRRKYSCARRPWTSGRDWTTS